MDRNMDLTSLGEAIIEIFCVPPNTLNQIAGDTDPPKGRSFDWQKGTTARQAARYHGAQPPRTSQQAAGYSSSRKSGIHAAGILLI